MTCALVRSLALFLAVSAPAAAAPADAVKLVGRPVFRNVLLSDYRDGRIIFRGVSGEYLRKPLGEVEWLECAACPPLTEAEHAAAEGQWAAAATAYQEVLRSGCAPWADRLARVRLLVASDRAGRFDEAVLVLSELLRDYPLETPASPRRPGPPGSETNSRAITALNAALSESGLRPTDAALHRLLLELLLYEEADEVPFVPEGSDAAAAAQPTRQPVDRTPLLGLPVASPPKPAVRVRLPGDSWLIDAAARALDAGEAERCRRLIERALPFVAPDERGPWRLVLARARIAAGAFAEAANDLLPLTETAAAVYHLAVAHEGLGRPDVAQRLYRELLASSDTPPRVRVDAARALDRLGDQNP
jgi:tetratricopeptide (TPR) repeat protein